MDKKKSFILIYRYHAFDLWLIYDSGYLEYWYKNLLYIYHTTYLAIQFHVYEGLANGFTHIIKL